MTALPDLLDADRQLALGYAPAAARAALHALFALDERLGGVVARAGEPTIGLMRLTWWRDRLEALGQEAVPAEPLLAALAAAGLPGPALAASVAGWEALLEDPDLGPDAVDEHARARGEGLFALAGAVLGAGPEAAERLAAAGRGWALADLARHLDRPARAEEIQAAAAEPLTRAMAGRWPRHLRPLGQLAALAARPDLSPRGRALRVLRHQLTGR